MEQRTAAIELAGEAISTILLNMDRETLRIEFEASPEAVERARDEFRKLVEKWKVNLEALKQLQ